MGYPHVKNEVRPLIHAISKDDSKWIIGLNVRPESKVLRRKQKSKSSWFGVRQWFLNFVNKCTRDNKKWIVRHQNKDFCASKNSIKIAKRQWTECMKILAYQILIKNLYLKIYDLLPLNNKKDYPTKSWQRIWIDLSVTKMYT